MVSLIFSNHPKRSCQTHLSRRNSGNNQIQRPPILRRPLGLIIGGNVKISAHLQRILLLAHLSGNSNNLISTHSLSKQETKVSQSTNTNDPNFLARSTAIVLERTVQRSTTTQHRRSINRSNLLRDLDSEMTRNTVVLRVSAVGLAIVIMSAVVGADHFLAAVVLSSSGALFAISVAIAAGTTLRPDTHTVTDLDVDDLGSHTYGCAYDLMPDTAGVGGWAL